jgi:hypothetical protein
MKNPIVHEQRASDIFFTSSYLTEVDNNMGSLVVFTARLDKK